jgi:Fe-S cluster assembly scaffold protein SufB
MNGAVHLAHHQVCTCPWCCPPKWELSQFPQQTADDLRAEYEKLLRRLDEPETEEQRVARIVRQVLKETPQ